MDKDRLSNDEKVSGLLAEQSSKSRVSHSKSAASPPTASSEGLFADLSQDEPLPVLIRATNGKSKAHRDAKLKFSTVVQPDDLESFFNKYAETCRAGMTGLKKRDRSKAKRKKKAKGGGEKDGAAKADGGKSKS